MLSLPTVGNYLANRFCRLAWGAVLMLTATCSNAGGLLATRFFLGIAESGIAPGMSIIVSMWYTRSEQPLRQGAWFLGNTIAGLLGGLIGYGLGNVDAIAPWKACCRNHSTITAGPLLTRHGRTGGFPRFRRLHRGIFGPLLSLPPGHATKREVPDTGGTC